MRESVLNDLKSTLFKIRLMRNLVIIIITVIFTALAFMYFLPYTENFMIDLGLDEKESKYAKYAVFIVLAVIVYFVASSFNKYINNKVMIKFFKHIEPRIRPVSFSIFYGIEERLVEKSLKNSGLINKNIKFAGVGRLIALDIDYSAELLMAEVKVSGFKGVLIVLKDKNFNFKGREIYLDKPIHEKSGDLFFNIEYDDSAQHGINNSSEFDTFSLSDDNIKTSPKYNTSFYNSRIGEKIDETKDKYVVRVTDSKVIDIDIDENKIREMYNEIDEKTVEQIKNKIASEIDKKTIEQIENEIAEEYGREIVGDIKSEVLDSQVIKIDSEIDSELFNKIKSEMIDKTNSESTVREMKSKLIDGVSYKIYSKTNDEIFDKIRKEIPAEDIKSDILDKLSNKIGSKMAGEIVDKIMESKDNKIINDEIMSAIEQIKTSFKKDVSVSFAGNKVYMLIEKGSLKLESNDEGFKNYKDKIKSLVNLYDSLR